MTMVNSQMRQIKAIKDAIRKEQLDELKRLGIKHGFINDKLRKKAWPLMLGIKTILKNKTHKRRKSKHRRNVSRDIENVEKKEMEPIAIHSIHSLPKIALPKISIPKPIKINSDPLNNDQQNSFSLKINTKLPEIAESKTTTTPPPSSEYSQIEKDIGRSSLKYYTLYTKKGKTKSEASLSKILHEIFDDDDDLHYIQGFNDVTSVFYAVCNNEKLAQKISHKVAKTLLSDFIMINDDEHINIVNYKLIFDIIECYDKLLRNYLDNAHDFISISISWQLTWFAHQIEDITVISRIYDYCLCSDKLISSYLSAALMIYLRDELIAAFKQDISLFEFFTDVKWDQLDFDKIIHLSDTLHVKYSTDLNQRFKEHINARNDLYYTDSTDSPVPVTPYTPYTPFTPSATPRKTTLDSNTSSDYSDKSPFDSIDFTAFKNERPKSSRKRKITAKKDEIKKAIKGFIDNYKGKYEDDQQ